MKSLQFSIKQTHKLQQCSFISSKINNVANRIRNLNIGLNYSVRRNLSILDTSALPIIETKDFINGATGDIQVCKELIEHLRNYGALAIRDPRVDEHTNNIFLDNMEKYFESRSVKYYAGDKIPQEIRPEYSYQIGATPERLERARTHKKTIANYAGKNIPSTPQPPPKNGAWRFFWRVGETENLDENLLPPQVIPEDFPNWETDMNRWGYLMRDTTFTLSEMIALGFGWERNTLLKRLEGGAQLLAPTGSDLVRYNKKDDVLAGFHYDLNFISIHGKSRYPGLSIWLKDGTKMSAKIPDGCLLIQAAKQLEWLTGGYIEAGFHEVAITNKTIDAVEKAKKEGRSLWRVSSTMFSQIRMDETLQPLNNFATEENMKKYPPTLTYDQVSAELSEIELLSGGEQVVSCGQPQKEFKEVSQSEEEKIHA